MKILAPNYSFSTSTRQVFLSGFSYNVSLNQLLLVTNVSKNAIIYNFADPAFGGTITSNILTLSASTTGMSNSDVLQIFLDDLVYPATETTLSAANVLALSANSYLQTLTTTVSTGVSAVRVTPVYSDVDMITPYAGHMSVGGRFVESSSFTPTTTAIAASALSGFDASFNVDATTGGLMALQGDLDKDIDSVTNFDAGYSSVSSYVSGATLGTDLTGTGTQVLSGNYNRISLFGQNLGTAPLLVKYGLGCNVSSFSFVLAGGANVYDGTGEKFSDDRYKGDVSVNTTTGLSAQYIFWEGV